MTATAQTQDFTAVMKNALQQIRELKAKLAEAEKSKAEPIALIGIGCRFPQGSDRQNIATPAQFWEFLCQGGNAVTETPADRWDLAAIFDPDPTTPGKTHIRQGSFLAQVDGFEPQFFNLAPREAVTLDPQQRLLLETSWEALEAANIVPSTLVESATGVFIGICGSDYATLLAQEGSTNQFGADLYARTGVDSSVAAGRLSYVLGLTGPCIAVDTACSSSLVALHQACQSLRQHECDLALAGGVGLILSPENTIAFAKAGMLAADGRCKTFDAAADGYVRGEGCGIIVLKRLADAQADGDTILALIRGSMINHDGPSSGLTVPRGPSQQAVIRQALQQANLSPRAVSYIEAHGTGTPLGDPIELGALGAIFGDRSAPLWVGSVKTNIGHLEAAAGIAGVIKVVLMLQHGQIPPHLHCHHPNPHFDWAQLPLQIPTTLSDWPVSPADGERVAGISSFGYSGTNAHLILSSAPVKPTVEGAPIGPELPLHLLTLAARSEPALVDLVKAYQTLLTNRPAAALADLCYTAQTSRTHFPHRLAIPAASVAVLQEQLAQISSGEKPAGVATGYAVPDQAAPKIAFLFTGQGAQAVNMGHQLYATQPLFRQTIDRCDAILLAEAGYSLREILYPTAQTAAAPGQIDQTQYTQSALFVLEYALATLWQSWGIQPDLLLGHSIGEVTAACVAGVFSLEDGLKLVAARGRLMGALPRDGAMVSLMATEAQVQAAIAPYRAEVSIAAVNGPESVVISGKSEVVLAITGQLATAGIKSRRLTVSHAFHSPLMEPMLAAFRQVAASITYHEPKLRLVSNVTGKLAGGEITTPDYWVRHVREAVRFADGITTLAQQGVDICVEIGPKPVLLGMAGQILDQLPGTSPRLLPSLRDGQTDWQPMLTSLGELYVRGVAIDWAAFAQGYPHRKIVLPTYPFQRQRYWLAQPKAPPGPGALRPLIDHKMQLPRQQQTIFEKAFSTVALPFLADHHVYGEVVVPGACHLALALSGAELLFGATPYVLEDVIFPQALALLPDETRTVQLIVDTVAANSTAQPTFQIFSFTEQEATAEPLVHATGRMARIAATAPQLSLAALQARCQQALLPATLYATIAESQIALGPTFRWFTALWHNGTSEALAQLQMPAALAGVQGYGLFPSLIDSCFQLVGAALFGDAKEESAQGSQLPFALEALTLYGPTNQETLWCHAQRSAEAKWDIALFTATGQVVAQMTGFQLRAVPPSALLGDRLRTDWLYTHQWEALPLPTPPYADQHATLPQSWLLVGAANLLTEKLVAQLQAAGTPVSLVAPVACQSHLAVLATQQRSVGVLYLGNVGARDETVCIPQSTLADCSDLLHLAQALISLDLAVHLWVVTQGCQMLTDGVMPSLQRGQAFATAAGGALWGFARTLAQEQPQLHTICVDLDPMAPADQMAELLGQELVAGLGAGSSEREVLYRQGTRYVARLHQMPTAALQLTPAQPQRLQLRNYGMLEQLHFVPLARRTPGVGEIEIEVKGAGLNFRDVLNTLGLLQDYYASVLNVHHASEVGLGLECAGVVTAVGAGVTGLQVGDRVMGLANGAFAHYLTLPARALVPMPAHLTFAEAATIPLAFLTAWYGLVELAKLQPGERVLIHAAAGGVGQAAVQIAQAIGAEIFATASPSKWDFLRGQGIPHPMNSRTLDFADEIRQATAGQGVDVVLNSLTGDFIERSVAALRPGGRFVEIGKVGSWSAATLAARRPDVHYYPFDIGEVESENPARYAQLWQALLGHFTAGTLRPLPHVCFPAAESIAAFRTMQGAKHTGKLVIDFAQPQAVVLHESATYLITGGLGALGLQVAQQLVADGARQLVLTGRRGVTTTTQRETLAQLTGAGAQIHVLPVDIADGEAVRQLLAACQAIAPLRGIIHGAGLLDDGVVTAQTPSRLATVMQPKVDGTWHLHTLTQGLDLDFFVCFSSMAALLGAPGQSNYAAANAFMDSLMQQRHQAGLPGLSINWGPWREVGMAAGLQAQLQAQGIGMIAPAQGRLLFRHLLQQRVAQIGVLPLPKQPPTAAQPPNRTGIRDLLVSLPAVDRHNQLEAYLRTEITTVLGLRADTTIDPQTRLFDFGFDSLMAVEMKNKLERTLGATLRSTLLFDYPTLRVLTPYLLVDVLGLAVAEEKEPVAVPTNGAVETLTPTALDELSEDEISDMLLSKLDKLGY